VTYPTVCLGQAWLRVNVETSVMDLAQEVEDIWRGCVASKDTE
jgi:hypothetical protein